MSEQEKPKRGRKKTIQPEQEASVELQSKENISETKSFLQVLRDYDEVYKGRLETTEPTPLTLAIARLETKLEKDPSIETEYAGHLSYWNQVWEASLDIQSRINTIVFHIISITK